MKKIKLLIVMFIIAFSLFVSDVIEFKSPFVRAVVIDKSYIPAKKETKEHPSERPRYYITYGYGGGKKVMYETNSWIWKLANEGETEYISSP